MESITQSYGFQGVLRSFFLSYFSIFYLVFWLTLFFRNYYGTRKEIMKTESYDNVLQSIGKYTCNVSLLQKKKMFLGSDSSNCYRWWTWQFQKEPLNNCLLNNNSLWYSSLRMNTFRSRNKRWHLINLLYEYFKSLIKKREQNVGLVSKRSARS